MFDFIRKHQRLVLAVLIILVVPSFVFLGVSGYTNVVSSDSDLVKVGKTTISEQAFDQMLRRQLDSLQGSTEGFDPALLDQPEVRRALLDQLIERQLLVELAQTEYFSASDNALRTYIASLPELQDNGSFSPERYEQALRMMGLDAQGFEQSQRMELALQRVIEPILSSAYLPQPVQEWVIHAMVDGREVQRRHFPLSDDLLEQSVSDEEITEWYEMHRNKYALPDYVNIEYVVLDEAAARQAVVTPSDEELKSYYEQNKGRYQTAGRAHIAHILVVIPQAASEEEKNEAYWQAQELAQKAQVEPDAFADLAREFSQDSGSAQQGGDLGWLTQGALPAALDEVVFELQDGEISEVVEGADGYHIFKAIAIEPQQTATFEAVYDELVDEVTEQLAADLFAEMATELNELIYDHADSLEPAAQTLGLNLNTAEGLGREAAVRAPVFGEHAVYRLDDAKFLEDPQLRRAVFDRQSLRSLENAGVIEIAPDLLVAVRATEYVPAHVPELDLLKDTVADELRQHKALEALKAQVEAETERLRQGEADAANYFGAPMVVSRTQPQQLDRDGIESLLHVPTDELPAYVTLPEQDGYAIYQVNKVVSTDLNESDRQYLVSQLKQLWQESQERAVMKALAQQVGVEELPGVEQAIYVEDEDL